MCFYQKENQKIQLVQNRIDASDSALTVLQEISRRVPQQVSLSFMIFEDGKMVSLHGTSTEISEVFRLVNRLEELPLFRGVETKKVKTKRRSKNQEVTKFEIIAPLS